MIDLFELYFYEDCPYEDESVELLGIQGKGSSICIRLMLYNISTIY